MGWFVDVIHTTPNLIVDYAVPGLIALAVFLSADPSRAVWVKRSFV